MTSATAGLPANVSAYLAQLRAELSDLAAEERDDLLAEVEASLLESAGEEPLATQFGPPAQFAAELRASAGLPPAPAAKPARAPRIELAPLLARARTLAPIWWALRGYVAVAALALLAGTSWSRAQPAIPTLAGGAALGVAAILAGVAISVGLALHRRVPRGLAVAANLVLLAAIVPVAVHNAGPGYERIPDYALAAEQRLEAIRYEQAAAPLAYRGEQIRNVYPYDRRGKLLHDVRLYDDRGRPLDLGDQVDPTRRAVTTKDGAVLNAFPIRYFDPGTGEVTDPDAGPEVLAPPIETPPLK
jgi:uncharacterized membrane protein